MRSPRLIWLRLYRIGIIAAIAWLVHEQGRWFAQNPHVSFDQAKSFFPSTTRVDLRDADRGLHYAVDAEGNNIGVLLTTSPHTDDIIGYSGANNLLIAVGTNGAVAGVQMLSSGDTPEHVDLVLESSSFLNSFRGWKPTAESPPKIEGVAGATLTSYAIAEAIQKRLVGTAPSLRFPEPVTLAEVRTLFTNATAFRHEGRRLRVADSDGRLLGFVARTSPEADNVAGYRGPTETLVAITPDERRITGVRIRRSYDTPSYAAQIREEETYLKLFEGKTVDEIAALDYRREKIEGVSGATETSYAIAEGMKRRFTSDVRARALVKRWLPKPRDWALAGVVAGACIIAFTPLRGKRWVRIAWQAVLIGYVGLVSGDLLSIALLGGWADSGLAFRAAPGLVLMAAVALLVPLLSRRQLYCHHICPHGAVQQWLGALNPHRRKKSRHALQSMSAMTVNARRAAQGIPLILLGFAIVALLARWPIDLAQIEPFDAWVWRTATVATLAIMLVGFVASVFVPQAYCRFGCPTGALLNFVRTTGSGDRWGARDWAAGGLLVCALLVVFATRAGSEQGASAEITVLNGRTMGTTWSVKIRGSVVDRGSVQGAIQAEFDRIEQLTSHWRSNTPIAKINAARTTEPIPAPDELTTLLLWSSEISEATGGAFDVTVAPLIRVWGFGPAARRNTPPNESETGDALRSVGWTNLTITEHAVRKVNPATEIDLSSIVPGHAVDRVTQLLSTRGFTNALIESGGELRALGEWQIGIEHPARSCILSNESIGTSGTYRQKWKAGGKTFSHLLDPRAGRPVTHNTVSASVRLPGCARADAWAAALNVLGAEAGLPLAESRGLAAQFVVETNGQLSVHETSHWQRRQDSPAPR